MSVGQGFPGRLPESFLSVGSSSFVDFLAQYEPNLVPWLTSPGDSAGITAQSGIPHGTTIVAVTFDGGVILAGDRRATIGSLIANRTIEKVFAADAFSVVGVAGTAGIALELVRVFQLEIEHFEKIEGVRLSLEGKANRLATLIRSNLGLALRGLAAVPIFAGFDEQELRGRVFSYDLTGGRYEEAEHHSVGSGSVFARGSLKKRWHPGLDESGAIKVAVEALIDAADDDAGTGGPDSEREIYPIIRVVDAAGQREVPSSLIAEATRGLRSIRQHPGSVSGPGAQNRQDAS